jgi:hypothetical protein
MTAIFHSGISRALPLRETQVAGAPSRHHASEPRLLTQPRQHAVGVGRVNGESVELSTRAAGSAQAHIEHLVAAFSQQLRHPVQRHAAPVGAAQQHQRGLVDVGRIEAVRQQRHAVPGRDHQVAFNPNRVRAQRPHAEHSAQKAHRLVPIRVTPSQATTPLTSRLTLRGG